MIAATSSLAGHAYDVIDVSSDGVDHMLLRFSIQGESGRYAVRLPLPTSRCLKPWLSSVPHDVEDAVGMLEVWLNEEVDTGCARWGVTTHREDALEFEVTPYGFRCLDPVRHRRLTKAAGVHGWSGYIQENDVPAETSYTRKITRLRGAAFTYREIGATSGALPSGYHTLEISRRLGAGADWFRTAAGRLLTWDMHRRAGLLVNADSRPTPGGVAILEAVILGRWLIFAPVRVIDVVDEPTRAGFTYGTLPGHPESGEERFEVRLEPDGTVRGEIRAFSRPGRLVTRLGGPIARRMQDATTRRYLAALTDGAT